jgi:hypothetical protein
MDAISVSAGRMIASCAISSSIYPTDPRAGLHLYPAARDIRFEPEHPDDILSTAEIAARLWRDMVAEADPDR